MVACLDLIPSQEYGDLENLRSIAEYEIFTDYFRLQEKNWKRLKDDLDETSNECSKANWDGYNALPISIETCNEATKFLDDLPFFLPLPCIVPQPDGGIAFEWLGEEDKTFIASFNGEEIIYLSWYMGNPNSTGNCREILSNAIPSYIVRHIRLVCDEYDE